MRFICRICNKRKNKKSFVKNKNHKYGIDYICLKCKRIESFNYKSTRRKEIKEQQKRYYHKNKKTILPKMKEYYIKNREFKVKYANEYMRKREKVDIQYKLGNRLRSRFKMALKTNAKKGSAIKDLGCTIKFFKRYIESKFKPGMSWDNWGTKGWHLDHIKPLNKFDLTKMNQVKKALHYTNYQPLWARDNIAKGAR